VNRIILLVVAASLFLFIKQNAFGFILIDDQGLDVNLPIASKRNSESNLRNLVEDLERITALDLYVEKGYLRANSQQPLTVAGPMFASVMDALHPTGRKWSATARDLLLSAIKSPNIYRVRGSREADFGRVFRGGRIELDFEDLSYITFRDVPRETFDPAMIFLHELVHRHLGLLDPSVEELKMDPDIRGGTVEYVNRIERELGLPERLHYFPKKSLDKRNTRLCIYFGKGSDRIEIDPDLFMRKYKNQPENAYLGLLRR
jgi:hypothetical protein